MVDIVNILTRLQREVQDAGITLRLNNDQLYLEGPAGSSCLRIVRLYRPSSDDVKRAAAPDVLLVLRAATRNAIEAAAHVNHILVPGAGYRILAPGIALFHAALPVPTEASRQVRLTGRTGVLAESLLLGGKMEWSLRELADDGDVSPALAHRVVSRLEQEGLLTSHGQGPEKVRTLPDPRVLAELWSQEERIPPPLLRGFLYAASTEALARKVIGACPEAAIGGTLAANLYRPVLTRIAPPLRIWVPGDFNPESMFAIGVESTNSGANVEFMQAKGDPWHVHRRSDGLPRVSSWRAWLEVAHAEGRTQELAEALLHDLE